VGKTARRKNSEVECSKVVDVCSTYGTFSPISFHYGSLYKSPRILQRHAILILKRKDTTHRPFYTSKSESAQSAPARGTAPATESATSPFTFTSFHIFPPAPPEWPHRRRLCARTHVTAFSRRKSKSCTRTFSLSHNSEHSTTAPNSD